MASNNNQKYASKDFFVIGTYNQNGQKYLCDVFSCIQHTCRHKKQFLITLSTPFFFFVYMLSNLIHVFPLHCLCFTQSPVHVCCVVIQPLRKTLLGSKRHAISYFLHFYNRLFATANSIFSSTHNKWTYFNSFKLFPIFLLVLNVCARSKKYLYNRSIFIIF